MTDTRDQYHHVAGFYAPVAAGVIVLVFGLVIVFAWRYRAGRSGGAPESRRADAPRVEALYVLALAVLAAVLLAATYHTENREDRLAPHPAMTVAVTAAKWRWRFDYPGTGVSQLASETAPAQLVVPSGETIRFTMTSLDVIHALWIPERRFKRDATPGQTTTFDLTFPARGTYTEVGECSEFCGLDHADMRFTVRALPPAQFAAWLRSREAAP